MQRPDDPSGPATNLLRSGVRLFGSFLAIAQNRVELLTTEVQEEIARAAKMLLAAFAALLAGVLGLLMIGMSVVVYFWDTHRLAAVLGVAAVFVAGAAYCALIARAELRERPRLLHASRSELERDVAELQRRA